MDNFMKNWTGMVVWYGKVIVGNKTYNVEKENRRVAEIIGNNMATKNLTVHV